MQDQADTLRRLMQEHAATQSRHSGIPLPDGPGARVMTVASGKGGVGKSCFVTNIGVMLARQGLRVLLVDGDTGLANLDILLGLPREHRATLEQVLDGEARIQDAIVGVERNLWLIPSSSGLLQLRQSGVETRLRLLEILEQSPWEMDLILLDAGAGIQQNVLSLHSPAYESVVMLTPEPTSLADAYSLIKLLRYQVGISRVSVIVNQVTDGRQGLQTFQKLKDVAARFTDVDLEYLGHWQRDEKITLSVMKRKILLDLNEPVPSVPCLELLAKRITAKCKEIPMRQIGETTSLSGMKTSGRFMERPAHEASKNAAKFWRTLLLSKETR